MTDLEAFFISSVRHSPRFNIVQKTDRIIEDGEPPEISDHSKVLISDHYSQSFGIQHEIISAIASANKTVYLVSPYFLPTKLLEETMIDAVDRGVSVEILTTSESDVPFFGFLMKETLKRLVTAGIRVYFFKDRKLHAKMLVVDSCFSLIGSFNYDRVSFKYNVELCIATYGNFLPARLAEVFNSDVKSAVHFFADPVPFLLRFPRRIVSYCSFKIFKLFYK